MLAICKAKAKSHPHITTFILLFSDILVKPQMAVGSSLVLVRRNVTGWVSLDWVYFIKPVLTLAYKYLYKYRLVKEEKIFLNYLD